MTLQIYTWWFTCLSNASNIKQFQGLEKYKLLQTCDNEWPVEINSMIIERLVNLGKSCIIQTVTHIPSFNMLVSIISLQNTVFIWLLLLFLFYLCFIGNQTMDYSASDTYLSYILMSSFSLYILSLVRLGNKKIFLM